MASRRPYRIRVREGLMMMSTFGTKPSKRNKRDPLNRAKSHYLYTSDDVMRKYGISRNTLTNRIKHGLPVIEGVDRLFRGCDLNQFHRDRQEKAKTPFARYEMTRFHCQFRLSLVDHEFTFERKPSGSIYAKVKCPECEKTVGKFLSQDDLDEINAKRETKTPTKSQHYNVSTNSNVIVQSRPKAYAPVVPVNEQAVYRYQFHIQERSGRHKITVDAALRSIRTFQKFMGLIPFEKVSESQIKEFKGLYEEGKIDPPFSDEDKQTERTGPRSSSTIVHCFADLKAFFRWLQKQDQYRKKISPDLPECFNPSKEHARIASASTEKQVPTLEVVRKIIFSMPSNTVTERRDQALIAFLLLSGMRDGAVVGLKLKHVYIERREIFQDPREIKTKNAKTMHTWWFPVGQDVADLVVNWIAELNAGGAQGNDPIFPQTPKKFSLHSTSRPWASATPLRKILKIATKNAGVKHFRVHAIRSTLAKLGIALARNLEELKAWSQNLGHENLETTMAYYGKIDDNRQRQLMDGIWDLSENPNKEELRDLLRNVRPENLETAVNVLKSLSVYNGNQH